MAPAYAALLLLGRASSEGHHHDSTEVADRGGEARDREHDASGENDVPPAAPGAREPDDEARPQNKGEHHDLYSLFQWRAGSGDSGECRVTFPNAGALRGDPAWA